VHASRNPPVLALRWTAKLEIVVIRNCLIALLVLGLSAIAGRPSRWSFTNGAPSLLLQDEQGNGLGRINTDDEPVPDFVHQMAQNSLFPPTWAFDTDAKGSPQGDRM